MNFIRRDLLTDEGVRSEESSRNENALLLGQLESNAWAALAVEEVYLAYGRTEDRIAARRIVEYSIRHLFDRRSGIFIEWKTRNWNFSGGGRTFHPGDR